MTGLKRVSSKFADAYFLIPSITFGARAPNCCNHIKEQVDALAPKVIRFLALCVILGMNEGWAMRAGGTKSQENSFEVEFLVSSRLH